MSGVLVKQVGMNWAEFDARAQRRIAELEPELLPEHRGEIITVEPESGDYFLAARALEAESKARAKYPHRIFYTARLGGGGVIRWHGRTSK
jgi:hypothetical protein